MELKRRGVSNVDIVRQLGTKKCDVTKAIQRFTEINSVEGRPQQLCRTLQTPEAVKRMRERFFKVKHTVLAISNCVGHDSTSYAVLKYVEVEF